MSATSATVIRAERLKRVRVKSLRDWFGMTQVEFAQALGVSRRTLAR